MAHETRIGLLVGMGFIICFAIILSNRGGLDRVAPQMPYQLFGPPPAANPPPQPESDVAQNALPALPHAGEPAVPPPARSRPAPVLDESQDPERFIQRRRSLLPSRELAGRGLSPAPDDVPADALDSDAIEADAAGEYAIADETEYPDDDTFVADASDQPDVQPQLPAALVEFADQLEVVTSESRGERGSTADPALGPATASDPPAAEVTHVIAKGDTLIHLARRYYGSSGKDVIDGILSANRQSIRSPESLVVGKSIRLPVIKGRAPQAAVATRTSTAPAASDAGQGRRPERSEVEREPGTPVMLAAARPGPFAGNSRPAPPDQAWRWYTVKKGDLYSTIAQEQLGTSKRWKELLELNKDVCPDARRLRQGVQIRIPNVALADAR